MEDFMSKLLVIFTATFIVSCSSLSGGNFGDVSSPGYQYGRQLDERAMRSGFFDR